MEVEELSIESSQKSEAFSSNQKRYTEIDEELTSRRREQFAMSQSESSMDARLNSQNGQQQQVSSRHQQGAEKSAADGQRRVADQDRSATGGRWLAVCRRLACVDDARRGHAAESHRLAR